MKTVRWFGWGVWIVAIVSFGSGGCASAQRSRITGSHTPATRSAAEIPPEAVEAVATAVVGRPVKRSEVKDIYRRAGRDPEAREALSTLSTAVTGRRPFPVYCPVDGERYSPSLTVCPRHGVALRPLDAEQSGGIQEQPAP